MTKRIFNTAGFLLIVFMVVLLVLEKSGSIQALIAGLAFLFFANIDTIKTFRISGTGFEAETREVVREAQDAIQQTKLLATEFAKFAILMINAEGRWGGIGLAKKKEVSDLILQTLRALNVDEKEVSAVADLEYQYVCFDYAQYITRGLQKKLDREKILKWNDFFSSERRKGLGYEPSPDELRDFLVAIGLMTKQRAELIEDYRFYKQNHRQRRPEIWATREHWND